MYWRSGSQRRDAKLENMVHELIKIAKTSDEAKTKDNFVVRCRQALGRYLSK